MTPSEAVRLLDQRIAETKANQRALHATFSTKVKDCVQFEIAEAENLRDVVSALKTTLDRVRDAVAVA